ncbi:FG-GAP repeat domain-containing protein [Oleiharenicola lentus]|uniref:FG-GAP repeat domain-containing protein n=1 Tax=Oleiharenicola lentus TaxID=2508720 RepID=UPI003F676713
MSRYRHHWIFLWFIAGCWGAEGAEASGVTPARFEAIRYRDAELTVDLGIGLWGWPVPADRNGDGLPDLILVAASSTSQGTYYFENTGRRDMVTGTEVFKPGVRLSHGKVDVTPSYTKQGLRVLSPGFEHPDFLAQGLNRRVPLPVKADAVHQTSGRVRGNQWSYVDYNGDGVLDLVVGVGDWTDYGWDNAYDDNGRWSNGPLHGFVYVLLNRGTDESPAYDAAFRLEADSRAIDMYGMPSPVFADFLGTGKLDLICGEFVDGLTFFENIGTREQPRYAPGRRLVFAGRPLTLPLAMIVVTAYDWNQDGKPDLVVGQEDGTVAWLENTGRAIVSERRANLREPPPASRQPAFLPPRFFRQEADAVKFGVLTTPVSVDWDGDGLADLITGNTAGQIAFIKNRGGNPPVWAAPELLKAGCDPIRILAGYNGSIQGPAEAKWGYNNLGVADWDGDGLPDILANTMTGAVVWFRNIGTRTSPELALPEPVKVAWNGPPLKPAWNWWSPAPGDLVVPWRCTPFIIDLDQDGLADLVTVDTEGYLAFYRREVRNGARILLPGERIFHMKGPSSFNHIHQPTGAQDGPLQLNSGKAGTSGRRTFCFVDWDDDGKIDLLVNSVNVNFLRNISTQPGEWLFQDQGPVDGRKLAGHSTSPTIVDWDGDGCPDLLAGAEDGHFYFLSNPHRSTGRK